MRTLWIIVVMLFVCASINTRLERINDTLLRRDWQAFVADHRGVNGQW